MKKTLLALALSATLLLPTLAQAQMQTAVAPAGYQLQQVFIFSRHNLRAPLNGNVLQQATSQSWPTWSVPGGHLTTKGGILEVYMGHFMQQWLAQQGLIPDNKCPAENSVYAYANSLQRTVATAQFFMAGAFPGCDITIHHQPQMGSMDPIFHAAFTRLTPASTEQAVKSMEKQLQSDQLNKSYQLLTKIVHYQNSAYCKEHQQCDLIKDKNTFSVKMNEEPQVSGPIKIANSLVDAFTLQYYQGFPVDKVAWGQIKTDQQWRLLSKLKNSYQDSLFTAPDVARHLAAPLIKYIQHALITDAQHQAKITFLAGHDSNIATLLAALDFAPYQLPGQYESTPIGGQIVFQHWLDSKNNKDLYKVEYVYQSTEQLRNATPLSLQHPPKHVALHMRGCPVDSQGFCPADKFASVFKQALGR